MDMTHILRLFPTLEIIQEELTLSGLECTVSISAENWAYRGVRLFTGRQELSADILYALRPGEDRFPVNRYAYVSTEPVAGEASHLICPGLTPEGLLDELMELFSRYQHRESLIDQLTYRNASLQELCELGAQLLENPVCIHDDWFIMIGMSGQARELMAPEYLASSTVGFVPSVILDDFKYDSDYLETYSHPNAQIWHSPGGNQDSLYVNLWDGTVYRGRLLVLRHGRSFRKADFLLAEVLTQRAIFLLQRKQLGEHRQYQSMDDIVFSLLEGRSTDASDLAHLMNMLNWRKNSSYLCIRLKSQQPNMTTMMTHILHSDLFQAFPGSYIMFTGHEQCMILQLDQSQTVHAQVHQQLAPLCRDYCLYAGISSPVSGIRELQLAYVQAGVALEQAFTLRSEKWLIHFSQCALDYVFENLPAPMTRSHLVCPELQLLIRHDREKGTQYFETLQTYLTLERDIPKTAQALIIHRTTLLYRLKKIRELTPMNLDDPQLRLYLMLSLWILEKENRKTAGTE